MIFNTTDRTDMRFPRLSAIWWGIGARLLLAVVLSALVWSAIVWALH
ncbi:MAG: hypothetical protein Q4D91_04110 [Lautropia sp.]|nr:hypothetical protein [Lautropia sp.]